MKRLVLDIETIPISRDELTAEDAKKAALDALSGKIICIGGLVVHDFEVKRSVAMVSDDEKRLLRWFWSMLKTENIRSFVAHNGLSFDLPFIWKRSVINEVKPSMPLDLRRYRTDFVYDTMCVWANWEMRGNVSLDGLSQGLDLGSKGGSGSQVLDLWRRERFTDIARYCLQDCWLTYACFCRMNFSAAASQSTIESDIDVNVSRKNSEETATRDVGDCTELCVASAIGG